MAFDSDGKWCRPSKVERLLVAARDELKRTGWTQGENSNARGEHCIYGVLTYVASLDEECGEAEFLRALGTVGTVAGEQSGSFGIVSWNDHPGRKLDEVIQLFDRALECEKTHTYNLQP